VLRTVGVRTSGPMEASSLDIVNNNVQHRACSWRRMVVNMTSPMPRTGLFTNSLCKKLPDSFATFCPDRALGPPPTPRTKNPTQEQRRKDNQQERDLQERQRQQREQEEQKRRERERQQREQEERARRAREAERREREESEQREREQRARVDAEQDISKRLLGDGPPVEVPTELVMRWTKNFIDEQKIGEGAFGDVFEGILADCSNQWQTHVAVKRLKPEIRLQGDENEQRAAVSSIRREIHVLSAFRHPHIIRLLGYTSTSAGVTQELCLVYDLGYASLDKMLTDDEKAQDLLTFLLESFCLSCFWEDCKASVKMTSLASTLKMKPPCP